MIYRYLVNFFVENPESVNCIVTYLVHAWNDEEKSRSNRSPSLDSTKTKDDSSLIFLKIKILGQILTYILSFYVIKV